MKIIAISREFGSGGRELGKRLAEQLGYDYYDREVITAMVRNAEIQAGSEPVNISVRRSFHVNAVIQREQNGLLLEQRRVIEDIAKRGRDCVIVGRNADVLLKGSELFNIFVCADMDARVDRCIERAGDGEELSRRQIEQNIRRIDRNRAKTRELLSGSPWGDRSSYNLIVNTTGWSIKQLTPHVASMVQAWFARNVGAQDSEG